MTYYEGRNELEIIKNELLLSYDELFKKSLAFGEKLDEVRSSFMTLDEVTNFLDIMKNDKDMKKASTLAVSLLDSKLGKTTNYSKIDNEDI